MTFEEWEVTRDNTIKFAQETIESMKENHSELSKLLGSAYTNAITDEVRDYNDIYSDLSDSDFYRKFGIYKMLIDMKSLNTSVYTLI